MSEENLWSENALARELELDRRTLQKRLRGLPPTRTKNRGNRVERFYKLVDVVAHLNAPNDREAEKRRIREHHHEGIKRFVGNELFPKLTDAPEFVNILTNGVREELGLDKTEALRVYQLAVLALTYGLSAGFQDDEMDFQLGDLTQAIKDAGGPEAWVAANWKGDN